MKYEEFTTLRWEVTCQKHGEADVDVIFRIRKANAAFLDA